MAHGLLALLLVTAGAPEPVFNGGFDQELSGWSGTPANLDVATLEVDGKTVARITVPEGAEPGYPNLNQVLNAAPGDLITVEAEARGHNVHGGYGAYMAVEFHDASGKRVSYSQSGAANPDGAWTPLRVQTVAPPETAETRVCLLLNGSGAAEFDHVTMTREPQVLATAPPDGPVSITVTDEIACPSLIGFGAEDDGWFYNPENAAHGVNEEDIKLREDRIAWMDPDWVRMFFWYKDWNPSGDWETFTFDSPNMASHYRTLDLYQRLGAKVNVVGVEWGVKDPYGNPDAAARAIGALFERLVRDKGYTCVQEWTLTNEPNGYFTQAGYDFERFVQLHRLVRAEFDRRGLNIRIVGSDETNGGFPFIEQCVNDDRYFQVADYFASHHYFPYADRVTAPAFFDERLDLLAKRTPHKDLLIAEFGFQDSRSGTLENPLMETYPYAVWTAAFVIEGLNRGVAGFSIWCLHEVYYPGNGFMNYGLWDYKDNGWKPRPVYFAWSNFSRLTESGDTVRKCTSSRPAHVIAALVGDVLFWVNRSEFPATVQLKNWTRAARGPQAGAPRAPGGMGPVAIQIVTESTLPANDQENSIAQTDRAEFESPPMSFGHVRPAN